METPGFSIWWIIILFAALLLVMWASLFFLLSIGTWIIARTRPHDDGPRRPVDDRDERL
ncbi:MAG: hypothetical protein HY534_06375 [Chloroflexi bacterium]|nr:hypothetical protein [Chloroflexota bacterium]